MSLLHLWYPPKPPKAVHASFVHRLMKTYEDSSEDGLTTKERLERRKSQVVVKMVRRK